ncbi:hypothetical protein H5410_059842, partial [Solanum commersonii]
MFMVCNDPTGEDSYGCGYLRMMHFEGDFLSNSETHSIKDQRCVSFSISMQALLRQLRESMMKYLILC